MSLNVDNDRYVLSLEEGRPYTASLKGIPEGDDYDLYIFDPNLLDFGMSFNNGNADEVINFTPVTTGNYYIHADSDIIGSGSDHSYQMLIYPDDTAPDAYEPNDSMGTSKTICNNTPVNGTINIDTDEDWYEFNVDNAGKLTVTLDSIPNNCDYDVEIYDGDSNVLSGSYFSDNTSEKADLLVNTGNYYVRIYSYSGSSESAYSLNVNLSKPDQYEVNDSVASATEVLVDSSTFGTIDNVKDEDYFRVDIEEAEDYIVELQNIPSGKDYDLSLFDSSGNAVAYSWNSSNNDELINMSLDAGCYYIKIHSYSGFSYEQNYMVSVYKEDALTLSMPYIRANAGDTISVPVAIQNLPTEGLCSFDFAVNYDATAMTYLDYTVDYTDPNGALVDTEQIIEANEECDGVVRVLFLDNSTTFTKPLNQSGIVIRLNFQVDTAVSDGAYDVSFSDESFAKFSGDIVIGVSHAIFKHGLVMIGSYRLTSFNTDTKAHNLISMAYVGVKGDINGDGSRNSIDFAMLRFYLLGKIEAIGNGYAADVNCDGDVNSLDFGTYKKYLLGKIKEFSADATINTLVKRLKSEPNNINYKKLLQIIGEHSVTDFTYEVFQSIVDSETRGTLESTNYILGNNFKYIALYNGVYSYANFYVLMVDGNITLIRVGRDKTQVGFYDITKTDIFSQKFDGRNASSIFNDYLPTNGLDQNLNENEKLSNEKYKFYENKATCTTDIFWKYLKSDSQVIKSLARGLDLIRGAVDNTGIATDFGVVYKATEYYPEKNNAFVLGEIYGHADGLNKSESETITGKNKYRYWVADVENPNTIPTDLITRLKQNTQNDRWKEYSEGR